MHSPVLSDLGFLRRTLRRPKTIKPIVVGAGAGEEEVDETDMCKHRRKPANVEDGSRLKQNEVDADDAVVEDTPPSKIKGIRRPQGNHDVEGSSRVRTKFGSVARGIKAKHPRLDEKDSALNRTRSGSVARGIKVKHPRDDHKDSAQNRAKSGSVARGTKAKHPPLRKHRDVNVGEIRETAYRASLNGIKTLIEELNLSDAHKKIMKKTPFWKIFNSIIENKLTSAHCRKSDKMIIKIINAYDPDTGGFNLGGKTIRITRDDIFSIFGITGGSEKVSFKYGSREAVEMVRRCSIVVERLSSSSLKELVKEYAVRNNKAGRQDFVRLLCAYLLHSLFFPTGTTVKWVYLERVEDLVRLRNYDWCGAIVDELMTSIRQHHDDPRRVSRCVVVLLVSSVVVLAMRTHQSGEAHESRRIPGIIKWRTMDLVSAFREIALNELESDQVVSRQPNVHDTNMVSENIDNRDAGLSREKIGNKERNDSAEFSKETGCSKRKHASATGKKRDSARMIRTQDSVRTVENFLKQSSEHTEFGAEIASRISHIRDSGPSMEYIGNQSEHDQNSCLIGELRDQIAKMKDRMKQIEELHAREIAIKDEKIESLDETVLVLLSENSKLWDQLTETAVHEVTQKYKPMSPEEEERSMITRLRARMRKDTQKEEYEYGGKRKRPTSESSKLDAEVDPKGVIDVDNFIAGPEKGPFKPKPIRNLRTNAVHRLLSSEEKAKIKKMWDEAYTSTIIWTGTVVGCTVFVEDIRQLIVDSAISGNVIDAYVEILSTEQGSVADQMQADCTQVTNRTVHVFTCSFLTMLGCKCPIERKKILERMMPQTASYRYLMFPIHFGYHWTLLVLDNEEGSWKFYNSMMERTGVDAHCKAAEQLKNQVESYWKSTRDGLLTTQDCEPIVTVQDCPQQEDSSLDCGVIVCYIIQQYYRNEDIAPILRKTACHKIRSEIVKAFLSGPAHLWS
ncbi:hypothetical protein RHSIM_Rhsim05G0009200 [Rhododendron simsii]|uniref:Ubiquitin-like protease family profile domain-containing protein n=1 Tax=Rhododendron simsii TaxID=118357 RepID=A0A834GYZ5_RHOSS|nr:hypothetical protein RHSIM_Rhsim05G0009200 [Rhododendron simsii]